MNGRKMRAVVNRKSGKVESYWNSWDEANTHIRRFEMESDFTIELRLQTGEQPAYHGAERRKS